jgi:hypothetical protein
VSRLVIILLPEDKAEDAPQIMRELLSHALAALSLDRAVFQFEDPPREIVLLARAQSWTSKHEMTRLARWMATQLALQRLLVLHVDADVAWPKRPQVTDHLDKLWRAVRHIHPPDNLVPMVPYAAIEAWTFRNVALAERLAQGLDPRRCAVTHTLWAEDPSKLEEIVRIKAESPLRDQHNLQLVRARWPFREAYEDARSFRAFVDKLAACPAIRAVERPTPEGG